jgi:hypothetical protein
MQKIKFWSCVLIPMAAFGTRRNTKMEGHSISLMSGDSCVLLAATVHVIAIVLSELQWDLVVVALEQNFVLIAEAHYSIGEDTRVFSFNAALSNRVAQ